MEGEKRMMDEAAALLAVLPPPSLPSLVLRAMGVRRGGDPVIGPGLSWGVSGPGGCLEPQPDGRVSCRQKLVYEKPALC